MTLNDAAALDKHDPLAPLRAAFALPEGLIYLDGNSLGPLPRATAARLAEVATQEWGQGLIRSWDNAGWMEAPTRVGAKIAQIIGAASDEVVVADSTSVNLFKVLGAALALRPGRRTLLLEDSSFPTDRHVAEGLAQFIPGLRIRAVAAADIAGAIDSDTAVVQLCDVHYRTGARHDMAALTAAAHAGGALAVWDLSHSVGAVPVDVTAADADFAVGCGYKFLNGGPGAPAFIYAARRWHGDAGPPLQGWIGHAAPFAFTDCYAPAAGVQRFVTGTPGILGLAALEVGVDLFLSADPALVWGKSAQLFALFAGEVAARCPALELLTPHAPQARGSHISFRHPRAAEIMRKLIAGGVIGDFRPPDVLRCGLTPLYTRFEDVWRAADALADAAADDFTMAADMRI